MSVNSPKSIFPSPLVSNLLSADPQLLEDVLVAQGIIEGQFRMDENLMLLKNNLETVDKIFYLLPDWLKGIVEDPGFGEYCNQMFDKVDADGNGKLTPDELFPIVTEMTNEHPLSITIEPPDPALVVDPAATMTSPPSPAVPLSPRLKR